MGLAALYIYIYTMFNYVETKMGVRGLIMAMYGIFVGISSDILE